MTTTWDTDEVERWIYNDESLYFEMLQPMSFYAFMDHIREFVMINEHCNVNIDEVDLGYLWDELQEYKLEMNGEYDA